MEAAKRKKLHLVHLCSDKGPPFTGFIRISATEIEKRNPFKAFGREFERESFEGMHVADKKTLKKDSSKEDSLMVKGELSRTCFPV